MKKRLFVLSVLGVVVAACVFAFFAIYVRGQNAIVWSVNTFTISDGSSVGVDGCRLNFKNGSLTLGGKNENECGWRKSSGIVVYTFGHTEYVSSYNGISGELTFLRIIFFLPLPETGPIGY